MRRGNGIVGLVLAMILVSSGGASRAAGDKTKTVQPAQSPAEGALHGGTWNPAGGRNFETVFTPGGVCVYLYTVQKSPAMVEGATGKAVVRLPGGKTQEIALISELPSEGEAAVYFCPMHPEVVQMKPGVCEKCGGMTLYTQNRLAGKIDLSKTQPGAVTANITVGNLSGKIKETTFAVSNLQGWSKIPSPAAVKTRSGRVARAPQTVTDPGSSPAPPRGTTK